MKAEWKIRARMGVGKAHDLLAMTVRDWKARSDCARLAPAAPRRRAVQPEIP